MISDQICSWLLPEEVEVGPLEVLIVKGKGEDCAKIGIIILTAVFFCERNVTKNRNNGEMTNLTIISVSRIKMKRIRYLGAGDSMTNEQQGKIRLLIE